MGQLTRHQLKQICEHIPEVRLLKKLKEKEKRKKEREEDENTPSHTIKINLNKLSKLAASDILKLIYSLKEKQQKFILN